MGSRRPLITVFAVAAVAVAVAAACGGGGGSAPSPAASVERALDTLERLKDRGCACQDAACFQPVQAEMDAWAKTNAAALAGATATRQQAERARAIDLAMTECQERFGVFTEAYRLADTLVAELRAYKDRFCACTTAGCIDQVELAMRGWRAARRDEVQRLRPTKKQDAAAAKIEAEIEACVARVGAKAQPSGTGPPP